MKPDRVLQTGAAGVATPEELMERVRERYGSIAATGSGCCGGPGAATKPHAASADLGYAPAELGAVPEGADLGLGCGEPIQHLDLQPGETVLDLGSGGGLDAFLAASRVGASGRVIGVDVTSEMIARARDNAARAGVSNVEFRQGRLEQLPVEDNSVDAVTSNCVINLVPDKAAVFLEAARVLRPGGRLVISDIVLDGRLPGVVERDVLAYVGCVAGAMQRESYFDAVRRAGLHEVVLLRDVEYLAPQGRCLSSDVEEILRRAGRDRAELVGKVRSVTFRAVKR